MMPVQTRRLPSSQYALSLGACATRGDPQFTIPIAWHAGVPKTLFGFNASDLVGRPLAAILDVFGLWRHKHGEDSSLLMLLASQALKRTSVGAADSGHAGTASWRVGVHQPVKTDLIAQHAAQLAGDDKVGRLACI